LFRTFAALHVVITASELSTFEGRAKDLLKNSEFSKEQEVKFHNKSVKLNNAVKYWPIFRILVLVVAGYVQATHVITYMKRKHIF